MMFMFQGIALVLPGTFNQAVLFLGEKGPGLFPGLGVLVFPVVLRIGIHLGLNQAFPLSGPRETGANSLESFGREHWALLGQLARWGVIPLENWGEAKTI